MSSTVKCYPVFTHTCNAVHVGATPLVAFCSVIIRLSEFNKRACGQNSSWRRGSGWLSHDICPLWPQGRSISKCSGNCAFLSYTHWQRALKRLRSWKSLTAIIWHRRITFIIYCKYLFSKLQNKLANFYVLAKITCVMFVYRLLKPLWTAIAKSRDPVT